MIAASGVAREAWMTRDEITALCAKRDELWQSRDPDALVSAFAEDAVAESPMQGRLIGRDRIRDVYVQWMKSFPDLVYKTEDVLVDGNRAVQLFSISGTQSAPFGGLAATGRKFSVTGAVMTTFNDDGKIVFERRLYDVTNMLVQLGALRAKPLEESKPTVFRTT
jgi:steroid delta-isomerase-like uncharacterized protein